jgi:hypothetical protein
MGPNASKDDDHWLSDKQAIFCGGISGRRGVGARLSNAVDH